VSEAIQSILNLNLNSMNKRITLPLSFAAPSCIVSFSLFQQMIQDQLREGVESWYFVLGLFWNVTARGQSGRALIDQPESELLLCLLRLRDLFAQLMYMYMYMNMNMYMSMHVPNHDTHSTERVRIHIDVHNKSETTYYLLRT
jgi:hypothetical protein